MNVQGSVALVTGANRGIGKSIAEELLARGAAKVYAGVRDVSRITDPRLVPVALDITDPARVAAVANELSDVTLVVNNAGIGRFSTPLQVTLEDARAKRDELPRSDLDHAGVRTGARRERRRGVREHAERGQLGWGAASADVCRV